MDQRHETTAAVRSRGIYKTPASTITKANEGTSTDRQSSSYDNEAARFGNTADGIVDTAGFPKDVYYFYKSRWTTNPLVHILPHWNWSTGTAVTIFVYHNCDSVELFLNNLSSYKGTSRKAFSGKVLAIVRSTGAAGSIVVTGTWASLASGTVTVTAR